MQKKEQFQKILAKEILIFFLGLIVFLTVWGIILLRNSYYESKQNTASDRINLLTKQLDSLQTDYIEDLYNQSSKYFVTNYVLNKDTFVIQKFREKEFLHDSYGIRKNVLQLDVSPKGYSYIHLDNPLKNYHTYETNSKRNSNSNDSILFFDYVSLEKFRNLIRNYEYQNVYFTTFYHKSFDPNLYIHNYEPLSRLPILTNKIAFQKDVSNCIKVASKRQELKNEIASQKLIINNSTQLILDKSSIQFFLIKTFVVIVLLFYAARLSFLLINWAIKTIRQK